MRPTRCARPGAHRVNSNNGIPGRQLPKRLPQDAEQRVHPQEAEEQARRKFDEEQAQIEREKARREGEELARREVLVDEDVKLNEPSFADEGMDWSFNPLDDTPAEDEIGRAHV